MANYSYKYPLLNDKQWLYEQYVVQQLSTEQLVSKVGCKTCNSIRQALLRFDIPVRSVSEGLTINRVADGLNFNKEVIDGCLLGDACLTKWNKVSDNSNPCFRKRNKHKDHIEYVATILNLSNKCIQTKSEKFKDNIYDVTTLQSQSHIELMDFYKRWYPENNSFKKIVPDDIVITSTVLLHWFMDDGCTWYRNDRIGMPVVGSFSSESFTKEENMMLIEKIKVSTGLILTLQKCNTGTSYRISIPTSVIPQFFEVIGSCPVKSFKYKWK